ncbi:MAG: box helicase [Sphingomonas bacterium]|uniref:DEAD/DEAH box helicase n=1 Tax=Sphingomonas bacterium TaxID=1895847 RepID=UPI00260489BA|nr:DEAD/DEAH box helicase [Sphingomonas bacterium]MDB5694895.1 box helicase [Sphingomonas bacterium]
MTNIQRAPVGAVAARAADLLEQGDVLLVLADEQRAEAAAAALAAAAPRARVLHLPSSDALPGDASPASPANVGRRVSALHGVFVARKEGARVALVTTAEAAARLQAHPAAYDVALPVVVVGDALDSDQFVAMLLEIGYFADDRVDEPGEMAARGGTIDIFPADAGSPARLEIVDGTVAAIRHYDPATQLGTEAIERLEVGRLAEPHSDEAASLFDHLPDAIVLIEPGVEERRDRFVALAKDAGGREPVLDAKSWNASLMGRVTEVPVAKGEPIPRFVEGRNPARAFARFARPLLDAGERIVLVGGERDLRFLGARATATLKQSIEPVDSWAAVRAASPGALLSLVMPVDTGWRGEMVTAIAAADLLGSRAVTDTGDLAADPFGAHVGEIHIGDVVVHEDFGIGVVAGLESLPDGDAIALTYAGDDRRLVPVAEADRIWRYGADADAVTLDKLDGSSWAKRRGAIDAAIAESAKELTRLAAERDGREAPVLEPDVAAYERFAAGFAFTETTDQARAITAVRADLASGKPMDRLVIGDVGYGKTEVALRAAAVAALAGAQVAITAPTTVLVRQHLDTFARRFAGTGVEVAGLSRLSNAAEKKRVKAGLADGSIGVVIGTGAVVTAAYKNLALTVIDEEQRFGAADKAKLRALGGDATHVLSLSATPIPRTLQTALVGLQQLSIIATPPARRQPIRTAIAEWDEVTVRTALRREKGRGGQSFVVVSRIEDMAPMAARLKKLVPELTIGEAHGKLPVGEIDDAMVAFASGAGDVLLATNIIEAGLDVPRANTMIVWRADRFGLSQLHQLRGRVGRGSRRGQVLLLTDPDHPIAPATVKRLKTLEAFDRLGAGFAIAARDLDMRGAGDLIGDQQAGHMKLIGVDLYQYLLEAGLRVARGEAVDRWTPELNLGVVGCWPAEWVPEEETRITLYARLARVADAGALDAFTAELEDRFGSPPPEARTLLDAAAVRLLAAEALIERIDAGPAAIAFTPRRDIAGDAVAAGLIEKNGRLLLAERIEDPAERLDRIRAVLDALSPG